MRLHSTQESQVLLQSVDFITPIVDDPFIFGQIAAANSLSDIYAMGGKPLFALNVVGFPKDDLPLETLSEILAGGIDIAHVAGIHVLGGHTVDDLEPKYGMVVTGLVAESNLIRNSTAKDGDILVLTKPLGTGIISTATKWGMATDESMEASQNSMILLNKAASEAAVEAGAHAMTDISGYGLMGHLLEMCAASGMAASVRFEQLQFLPGVPELAAEDVVPAGSKRNMEYVRPRLTIGDGLNEVHALLTVDAQTSGGLLIAIAAGKADDLVAAINSAQSLEATVIGQLHSADTPGVTLSAD